MCLMINSCYLLTTCPVSFFASNPYSLCVSYVAVIFINSKFVWESAPLWKTLLCCHGLDDMIDTTLNVMSMSYGSFIKVRWPGKQKRFEEVTEDMKN